MDENALNGSNQGISMLIRFDGLFRIAFSKFDLEVLDASDEFRFDVGLDGANVHRRIFNGSFNSGAFTEKIHCLVIPCVSLSLKYHHLKNIKLCFETWNIFFLKNYWE